MAVVVAEKEGSEQGDDGKRIIQFKQVGVRQNIKWVKVTVQEGRQ